MDRKKQRENRKLKRKEARLSAKNDYGFKDLTPFNAVSRMRGDMNIAYK